MPAPDERREMKLYKITDKDGKTRAGYSNECQWGKSITHKPMGDRNMTIGEAIYGLKMEGAHLGARGLPRRTRAVQLGIEALKRGER